MSCPQTAPIHCFIIDERLDYWSNYCGFQCKMWRENVEMRKGWLVTFCFNLKVRADILTLSPSIIFSSTNPNLRSRFQQNIKLKVTENGFLLLSSHTAIPRIENQYYLLFVKRLITITFLYPLLQKFEPLKMSIYWLTWTERNKFLYN